MANPTTPGQIAYAAYCREMHGTVIVPWRTVLPESRCAWEAAAQAVLTDSLTQVAQEVPHE